METFRNPELRDTTVHSELLSSKLRTLLLASIVAAGALAHSFVFITLPPLGRQMAMADTQVGMLLSLSALMIMLASPVWGGLCERWGRRPVILISLIMVCITIVATAGVVHLRLADLLPISMAFYLLLCVRISSSALSAGLKPGVQSYIADTTTRAQRVNGMGLMGAAFGVGTILGGAVAALSGVHAATLGFTIVALIIGVCSLISFTYLQETRDSAQSIPVKKLRLPYQNVWPFLLITVLALAIYSTIQQVTALRLQDSFAVPLDRSARLSGFTMMLTMIAMIITQSLIVKGINWPHYRLLLTGSIIAFVGSISAAFAPVVPVFIACTALLGVGLGMVFPANLAAMSLKVDNNSQGRIAGINGVAQGVGLAIGPWLGALLLQITPVSPYLFAAGIGVLMIALVITCREQQ